MNEFFSCSNKNPIISTADREVHWQQFELQRLAILQSKDYRSLLDSLSAKMNNPTKVSGPARENWGG
jgi:hypothetical protein